MGSWNAQRLAGGAGVLFIVLTFGCGFIVSPPPTADESSAKFLAYFADNRSALLVQMVVALLADIPAFVFASGFWTLLRREDKDGDLLATAAIIALVFGGVIATINSGWTGALGYLGDGNGLEEGTARTLSLLGTVATTSGLFVSFAAFAAASGCVLLRGSTLPKWLGWIGLVASILAILGVCGLAQSGPFSPFEIVQFGAFVGFSLYVVLVSVFMWLRAK